MIKNATRNHKQLDFASLNDMIDDEWDELEIPRGKGKKSKSKKNKKNDSDD